MKSLKIKPAQDPHENRHFEKMLLDDLYCLQRMIELGYFKDRTNRIGCEQEFCIVDSDFKAANYNQIILKKLEDPAFSAELAKFNVELNSPAFDFNGDCFSQLQDFLWEKYQYLSETASLYKMNIVLAGILPTIRQFDLNIENITPNERYFALVKALSNVRGHEYELRIQGIDELVMKYDSAFLESATTSFQLHIQVHPDEFAEFYNIAQLIAGPVLSAAVNSPLFFRKKLWSETRVALFQQSVDTRAIEATMREYPARAQFGHKWVNHSITEIYRDDATFHRILLNANIQENAQSQLELGIIPSLQALQIHNSTIYRWNRPCYGIREGEPYIRIENRILPAGPTIADQLANAALWYGLMFGIHQHYPDFQKDISFEDVRNNFILAARNGLQNAFTWMQGKPIHATELLLKELIPLAKEGLKSKNINSDDIRTHMDIMEERIKKGQTGSQWMISFHRSLKDHYTEEEIATTLTANTKHYQQLNQPVHTWTMENYHSFKDWTPENMVVEECMSTTLYTLCQTDIVQMAADIMDWQRIKYIPIEDEHGGLVGLLTSRKILYHYNRFIHHGEPMAETIENIMTTNLITINPEAKMTEAISLMQKYRIGCIPVVKAGKLIGMLTEQDFLNLIDRIIRIKSQ